MHRDSERRHGFDIIQNFGLMYHLRDPLLALSQCRSVLKPDGVMILETAAYLKSDDPIMVFNNNGAAPQFTFYPDITTWWAPTVRCLKEMLRATLFEPDETSVEVFPQEHGFGRVCMVAYPVSVERAPEALVGELKKTYRNPGLHLE